MNLEGSINSISVWVDDTSECEVNGYWEAQQALLSGLRRISRVRWVLVFRSRRDLQRVPERHPVLTLGGQQRALQGDAWPRHQVASGSLRFIKVFFSKVVVHTNHYVQRYTLFHYMSYLYQQQVVLCVVVPAVAVEMNSLTTG